MNRDHVALRIMSLVLPCVQERGKTWSVVLTEVQDDEDGEEDGAFVNYLYDGEFIWRPPARPHVRELTRGTSFLFTWIPRGTPLPQQIDLYFAPPDPDPILLLGATTWARASDVQISIDPRVSRSPITLESPCLIFHRGNGPIAQTRASTARMNGKEHARGGMPYQLTRWAL